LSDHISSLSIQNGSHISYMKPKYVTVQKHCVNESYLVTIPFEIAKAIPLQKSDVVKMTLENNTVRLEKV